MSEWDLLFIISVWLLGILTPSLVKSLVKNRRAIWGFLRKSKEDLEEYTEDKPHEDLEEYTEDKPHKKSGRPKGSKNKPKKEEE